MKKLHAGRRWNPWLGRGGLAAGDSRTSLDLGEVMQLPPMDEIVMVAGTPPIRAKKVRYYEDRRFTERVLPPAKSGERRPIIENGRFGQRQDH